MTKPKRFYEISDTPYADHLNECGCLGCFIDSAASVRNWLWSQNAVSDELATLGDEIYLRRCLLLMMGYGRQK